MTETTSYSPLKFVSGILQMIFRTLVGAYGLNVTLHVLAIFLIGDRWIVIEFLNTFAHLLWMPSLVLIPICLLLKEWRLVGLMLPALVGFVFIWGDMLLPKSVPQAPNNSIEFTIATTNLSVSQTHLDDDFITFEAIGADFVVMQEVSTQHITPLTDLSAESYPYTALHPNGVAGQGILSRYPILEDEYFERGFTGLSLGHQRVVLQISETQQIVVYSVHPLHPGMGEEFFNTTLRRNEISAILSQASQETLPVILAGDFNMPDFSRDYRMVTENYTDAFRVAGYGLGWTFPRISEIDTTFIRLDYIFLSEGLQAQSAQVWQGDLESDHNMVFSTITIENEVGN